MAKKKEEVQQKKWVLGKYLDQGREIISIISTYDSEEEANAALDKICILGARANLLGDAGAFFVTDAEHALDIEENCGVEYSIYISGVKTVEKKKKKNGKKKKVRRSLPIFDDVNIKPEEEDNDVTIGKVRDALSDISADDYEIKVRSCGMRFYRERDGIETPRASFGDEATVFFHMYIKGVKERGNLEVIREFFKRIGLTNN